MVYEQQQNVYGIGGGGGGGPPHVTPPKKVKNFVY
jgi:hypothetical protein